ncbi:MAG: quinone-dependent dihydroorotate dehydrogenase [Paraglaciecola chathamensis]|jgi:dihydroorotate dehydrogenase|uniref:Dihydroorotate dehydrogenase (quinone) n=1 Tax=Paraglaciecola agarilytica NO2 TaxID=1125747 RepID=A0ABQ0IDZ5_9ALTE|nr:quinone-dependent dihydroorotate dehydrogenase [Paraglaciecola agarilytica]AEE23196.1 dihydroorotate dehydrogenase [Glaciecola sp. 4H-3-7+YE-5]GAC07545.1 dihydroorotate dehydrogenase [Paraglaciecola agarilytica NO2]
MYAVLQKFLFTQDAEWSHDFTINWLKRTQHNVLNMAYKQHIEDKPVEFLGITFKNPVGLAAGLDKNAECIDAFAAMGFGFIEVGTVTPKPQAGNDKPRMFRLPAGKAIINRMGFNNKGVDYLVEQVKKAKYTGVLGINIGKNKTTPEEDALNDYLICLRKVYAHASYVTVNISSPNTPGLRNLQYGEALSQLLAGLKEEQGKLEREHNKHVPILIKIAPDLEDAELSSMVDSFLSVGIDGVIATNTTLDRDSVKGQQYADEAGGLSGSVLTQKSQRIVSELCQQLAGNVPVIGVGGIDSPEAAKARIEAGSPLIQVYSALIYQGPKLIKEIVDAL